MHQSVTGIILAGGKSSRMGKDKGFCTLGDKMLIEYAIRTLGRVCKPLLIGSNNPAYQQFGHRVVPDQLLGKGPVAGIFSCLLASETDDNFILSCDMPLITDALVRFVISKKADYDVVIPVFNGLAEPLCAFYHQRIVKQLGAQIESGVYKIQDAVKPMNTLFLVIEDASIFNDHRLFMNINSEADLGIAKHFLSPGNDGRTPTK